jgi:hypothetical protein
MVYDKGRTCSYDRTILQTKGKELKATFLNVHSFDISLKEKTRKILRVNDQPVLNKGTRAV